MRDAECGEVRGDGVGAGFQLGVGDFRAVLFERDGVWGEGGLGGELLV